jgi:hypothetical protein
VTPPVPAVLALRVLVGVTTGCGLLAMSATLLLPARLVVMELVLTLLTSWSAPALARRIPSVNVRLGCAVVIQLAVLVVGAPDLRPVLDAILAPLAVLLLAATAVEHTGVRQLVRGIWLGDACLLLTAGVQPEPVLAVPVVLAVAASAAALVVAAQARDVERTDRVLVALPPPGRPRDRVRAHGRWTVLPVVTSLLVSLGGGLGLAVLAGANAYGPLGPAAASFLDLGFNPAGAGFGGARRTASGYNADRLDLRARGDLGEDPLFAVPAGSPSLWRANVLDQYDGTAWQNTRQLGDGNVTQLLGDGDVAMAAEPDDPPDPAVDAATYEVRVLAGRGTLTSVIAPGPVQRLGPDVKVYRRTDGRLWVKLPARTTPGYQVTSTTRADAGSAAPGGAEDANPVDPRWLQLPDELPQRVRDLARQLTAGAPDRASAVQRVENHLRSGYRYQLDAPLPRRGQDAVDSFLFDARVGFCEQFATAEVILLRSVGIPARLATGFSGGVTRGGLRILQSDSSHAWAEVWLPAQGWVSSDPTASAALETGVGQQLWAAATRPSMRAVALVLIGLVVLAALVALGVAVRLGWWRRGRRPARRPVSGPLLVAFERLEVALRRAGQERPPWETLSSLAERLPDPAGQDGATGAALGVLERALYGPVPPAPQRARAAADVLDRVSAMLLAEDRRRREPVAAGRPGPGG